MKFRKPLKITSRTSSVTNGFVQAIIPSIEPTAKEEEDALAQLGMTPQTRECIYCGSDATDWDHLRPLVRDKRPTGYINEIRNMVPSCGPCNQSKSGADWRKWMEGNARGSPKTKNVGDLDQRIARIEKFVAWGKVERLELETFAEPEQWDAYWQRLTVIVEAMHEAQKYAEKVQAPIRQALEARRRAVSFGIPHTVVEGDNDNSS